MRCRNCGAEIDGEASFCDECGKPLQEAVVVSSGFLGLTDAPQARPARPSAKQAPAAERRPFARAHFSPKWNSPATASSHWNEMIRGLNVSPMEFYDAVRSAIERRRVPEIQLALVSVHEGGIFSAKRDYLRVVRKDHVLDICGAPYADGFFVSEWLGPRPRGCLGVLLMIPLVFGIFDRYLNPLTYYQVDTASMLLTAVHSSVLEVIDQMTEARGIRGPTELERKPVHRDFFRR